MFLLSNLYLSFIVTVWIQHALLPYRINDFDFFLIFDTRCMTVLNLHLSGCEVATARDSAVHQLPVISCSLSSTHTKGDYRPLIGSHTRCMTESWTFIWAAARLPQHLTRLSINCWSSADVSVRCSSSVFTIFSALQHNQNKLLQ